MIENALLFSMSTENFLLAFGRSAPAWCFGAVLGWIMIPLMDANMDVIFRTRIPVEMQGSVWVSLFGAGKGSGAAMLFLSIGILGILSCLPFRRNRHIWMLEDKEMK